MRVLVVEDDRKIASLVARGLREAGYAVDVAHDGEGGLHLAAGGAYDTAIVDVMLPKLDGVTLIERLRARGVDTPVLILSAKRAVDDRVRGLRAGGDDYLTKPFSFNEVLARVEALMEVAEAKAGAVRLEKEPVALRPLLREAVSVFAPSAEEKGIDVTLEEGEEVSAPGDRDRLRRVFANLLDNAIKYGDEGATVAVRLAREGGDAVVTVADTGRGIAEDALPRIWDRLYRADPSRSEHGLGLGLSLVRAIVEAHGGSVAAASRPGRGSTFTVRLPL